jgi:undecaprenyl diphosphate synthase
VEHPERIPAHIAIIMDGNGRWAADRGLPRLEGHREGARSVKSIVTRCRKLGVRVLTLYAFSEQNWGRPKTEVIGLMRLLEEFVRSEWDEVTRNDIQLVTIGNVSRLPLFVRKPLGALVRASSGNRTMKLCLALSYGGREQIVEATRRIARQVAAGMLDPEAIDEATIAAALDTHVLGVEPDLVIRTSGEQRLSNFLLWESAYTELYFTPTAWPDFREPELDAAIRAFSTRERRFGLCAESDVGPRAQVC